MSGPTPSPELEDRRRPGADWRPVCEHNWRFGQTVFWDTPTEKVFGYPSRTYLDRYYCTKCLTASEINPRQYGSPATSPLPGTLPK